MAAPKGNRFWEARARHGRRKKFHTPEDLWKRCCEYFEWVEENPLWEAKPFAFQGESWIETVPKMRAMTKEGLWLFIDCNRQTWQNYKNDKDYVAVVMRVETIIYEQKLTGAAADQLNANIIARDLGLKDVSKREHDLTDRAAELVAARKRLESTER